MYGCVLAETLQGQGYDVTLYEAAPDILLGASNRNFRRLHKGYHYPLSMETAKAAIQDHANFTEQYPQFTYPMSTIYWIANESVVSPEKYQAFVNKLSPIGVSTIVSDNGLQIAEIALGIRCTESLYEVNKMREYFKKVLNIKYQRPPKDDFKIDCTYTQSPLAEGCEYKEATILHIRAEMPQIAQTVLYGPFCGIIPAIEGGFMFYHAKYTDPKEMLADGARFFPNIAQAAILEVRNVTHARPVSKQDHRPYLEQQIDDRTIAVLGGKIAASVNCARDVCQRLDSLGIVPDKRPTRKRKTATG